VNADGGAAGGADEVAARRAADAHSRQLALEEFRRPLVVEAGAGTGKTATLVGRILAWCLGPGWERAARAEPDATPERVAERVLRGVVAITFTEAAAAEMDARVEQGLARLARGETVVGFDGAAPAERVAALRGGLDQLVVQTIHATCRRLLAAWPLDAGVHPFFEVDADGTARAAVAREVVREQLGVRYERGDADALELGAEGIGPRELEEELLALLGSGVRSAELEGDPLAPERVAALVARLADAHRRLAEAADGRLAEVARGKAREAEAALEAARAALAEAPAGAEGLAALRERLVAAWSPVRRKLADWAKGRWSGAEQEALGARCAAVEEAARRLDPLLAHLERVDPPRLARLLPLLAELSREVEERLRERGRLTFDELLARAADLLARSGVAARVRRGIDQLLVDEFQDTDPRQCAILGALALEGPVAERPGLFLVGDPKQSIYGWRNADLAAYEGFVERVRAAGGEVGALCVNHRSVPAVLDEVERVIAPVMRRESGLQPAFEPLVPSREGASAAGFRAGRAAPVEIWVSAAVTGDAEGDAGRGAGRGAGREAGPTPVATRASDAARLEARAIARDVRALHDAHGVAWRDVGLLFRSRGDWDVYLGALREAGVPYAVERDRTYFRRREILDASALVRCVLDPDDTLALVAALRSVCAGVPDAAWIPLWARGFPERVAQLEAPDAAAQDALRAMLAEVAAELTEGGGGGPAASGLERVQGWERAAAAAVDAIAALRRSYGEDPADRFVERLRAALAFEGVEASRFLGAWRAANLEHFFGQLAEQLAAGAPTQHVLRALRRAVAEEEVPAEEPAALETADAVSVLTLHGAKGLDWGHVYLAQLHKGRGTGRPRGEAGRVDGRVEACPCATPTLGFDAVVASRDRVEEAERVRTLYVGMTRARERLVLCGLWPAFQEHRGGASHAALLEQRRSPDSAAPARLDALARAAAASPDASVDAAGARWVLPALRTTASGVEAAAQTAAAADASVRAGSRPTDAATGADPARAAGALARHVARAAGRMAQRFGIAATELAGDGTPPRPADADAPDAAAPGPDEPFPGPPGAPGAPGAGRAAGTAIHRALEQVDLTAEPRAEAARLRVAIADEVVRTLPAARHEEARREALACWDTFVAGPLFERLRALHGRIVARELPVLLEPGSDDPATGFVSGAIDLVYRDEGGRLVIADYKTDRPAGAADARARREHYARQGEVYRRALALALGGAAPRFELWWLAAGRVDLVSGDGSEAPRAPAQQGFAFGAPE